MHCPFELHCLQLKGDSYHFCHVYRAPDSDTTVFDSIGNDIDDIGVNNPGTKFVVLGDLNCHNKNWLGGSTVDNQAGKAAEEFSVTYGFEQLVLDPTRVYTYAGETRTSVLDLVLVDQPVDFSYGGTLSNIGSSDHAVVQFHLLRDPRPPELKKEKRWSFKGANFVGLRSYLSNIPWKSLTPLDDPNLGVDNLYDHLKKGMNENIPKTKRRPKRWKPWYGEHLTSLRRQNELSYAAWKDSGFDPRYCLLYTSPSPRDA